MPRNPLIPSRYTPIRELGRGATGVVYEAVDLVRQRNVALKVVSQGANDLAAEFRLMSRLTPHPRLSAPLDFHPLGDGGCFTMDLAPGITLAELMREKDSLAHLTAVTRAVAEGLAVLHAHGLAHRDLKPANVLVDVQQGGSIGVRIVDLGLSRPSGTDTTGVTSGTWRYMAPELFLGAPAGELSDVYALGVILYEWIAGRPPHEAATPGELARAVLFGNAPEFPETPEQATWIGAILPRLLARRPEDRPPARDLAAILAKGAASSLEVPQSPLIGRVREMEIVTAAFDRATEGRPVLLEISGPPGVGRRRLLLELRLARLESTAGWFEINSNRGSSSLDGLGAVIGCLLGPSESISTGVEDKPGPDRVGSAGPSVSIDVTLAERIRLLEQLVPGIQAVLRAAGRGTLVFIFDAGAARAPGLFSSLEYLASEIGTGRVLFVIVSDEVDPAAGESTVMLSVDPLPVEDMIRLLRSAAPERTEPELARITEVAGGIPLLGLAMARRGTADKDSLPNSLSAWVAAQWRLLKDDNPHAAVAFEAASLLGGRFDAAMVADVAEADPFEVHEILAGEARPGGLLSRSGRMYAFTHPAVPAWIESAIPLDRKERLHAAAARTLSAANPPGDPEAIARHWLAAADKEAPAEAIHASERAAHAAYDRFDWNAARDWAGKAVELIDSGATADPDLLRDLLGLSARAAGLAGANEEASQLFRRLADSSGDPVIAARAIAHHAQILLSTLGETDAGTRAVKDALAALPEGTADLERAHLLEVAADGARIRGDLDEAITMGVESLRLIDKTNAGPAERSRVLATLGYARIFGADNLKAQEELEEARRLAAEAKDLYAEARALSHLAVVDGHLGEYEAIREHLEASAAIAEKIGDIRRLTAIDQSLAVADAYQARLEDARRRLARGRRRALAIGDRQILAWFDLTLGSVERSAGRFDLADAAFVSARRLAEESGISLAKALADTGLGWVALLRGRLDEARAHLTAPTDDSQDPMAVAQTLSVLALLLIEEGSPQEAIRLAQQALDLMRKIDSEKFEPLAIDAKLRARQKGNIDVESFRNEASLGLSKARSLNVPEYVVQLLTTRSGTERLFGHLAEAEKSTLEARDLARRHGLLPALVRALEGLADVWLAHEGLYDDRAEDALEEGLALARLIGMKRDAARLEERLAELRSAWE